MATEQSEVELSEQDEELSDDEQDKEELIEVMIEVIEEREPKQVSFSQKVTVFHDDDEVDTDGHGARQLRDDCCSLPSHGGEFCIREWKQRVRAEKVSEIVKQIESEVVEEVILLDEGDYEGEEVVLAEVDAGVVMTIQDVAEVIEVGDIDNFIGHMSVILS